MSESMRSFVVGSSNALFQPGTPLHEEQYHMWRQYHSSEISRLCFVESSSPDELFLTLKKSARGWLRFKRCQSLGMSMWWSVTELQWQMKILLPKSSFLAVASMAPIIRPSPRTSHRFDGQTVSQHTTSWDACRRTFLNHEPGPASVLQRRQM